MTDQHQDSLSAQIAERRHELVSKMRDDYGDSIAAKAFEMAAEQSERTICEEFKRGHYSTDGLLCEKPVNP